MAPFGFERTHIQEENINKSSDTSFERTYLDVNADMFVNGSIYPNSFKINDIEYKITKIYDCVNCKNLKNQNFNGFRYKCRVSNRDFFLFFENNYWFLEMRIPQSYE